MLLTHQPESPETVVSTGNDTAIVPVKRPRNLLLDGWINVIKPTDMTSARAVAIIKRATGARKVGHAGTLDPFASGVLPMALGKATSFISFVSKEKRYRFTLRWGIETDTLDTEGKVIRTSDERPSREAIVGQLAALTGGILQAPPIYSAIKIGGQRSYDLARRGETPKLEPRRVRVHRLEWVESSGPDRVTLDMTCGPGVYVRAIARDLGLALGVPTHVETLMRLSVGKFSLDNGIGLALAGQSAHNAPVYSPLPVAWALDGIPALEVDRKAELDLVHGRSIRATQAWVRSVGLADESGPDLPRNLDSLLVAMIEGGGAPDELAKRGPETEALVDGLLKGERALIFCGGRVVAIGCIVVRAEDGTARPNDAGAQDRPGFYYLRPVRVLMEAPEEISQVVS